MYLVQTLHIYNICILYNTVKMERELDQKQKETS